MSRPIEQALLSLLPTHNSAFPPPLLDLAGSLLAQSRHLASALKTEEEIARPYACANIACDRLKISLNLPPIEPRPPIPPRLYKRLYNHLDKILPNSSTTPRPSRFRTPSAKLRDYSLGSSPASRPTPSRQTPSKEKSLAQFSNPGKTATPSRRRTGGPSQSGKAAVLPPWVQGTVRFLCGELKMKQIAPTIMAGMDAIVAPHGKRSTDEWVNENLAPLLGALYFYVSQASTGHRQLQEAEFKAARKEILGVLNRARDEATGSRLPGDGDAWQGWEKITIRGLQAAIMAVSERSWLASDWFNDVQTLGKDDDGDEESIEPERDGGIQIRRADTMLQDRYDYLSERKREYQKTWEEEVRARIKQMESGRGDAMEVDL